MPTEVIMPQMGESIFEGTITRWLKKPGDAVEKDEPLLEISTDKVDAEIPAPVAGVLSEIKAHEGETVQVNAVIAVIGGVVAANAPAAASPSPRPSSGPSPAPASASSAPVASTAPAPAPAGGVNVVMPQMGESIFEGTITRWLKKPGDAVERDEPLLEISTDKVDAEIPAPVAGVLSEIRAREGETVQVNAVLAVIGGSAAAQGPPAAAAAPASASAPAPAVFAAPAATVSPVPVASPVVEDRRIRSSPLVRRMAGEHNLDLRQVAGTGADGRITKEDVLRHLDQPRPAGAAPAPSRAPYPAPLPSTPAQAAGQVVPLGQRRALIAQRVAESKRISPHVHTVYKIDMTRIAQLREQNRAAFEQRHGVKLTYLPFIAVAAVESLRRYPILNASLLDGAIQYHAHVNLGIAVALEWDFIVPVVRESEARSFADLARGIGDLATRARAGKLNPEETQGSTFTLSNFGVLGGEFGTPILNQPESAILAIGGLRKEPVALTDADGNDAIAIRLMQSFSLGFDHRIIDGADAGRFMTAFKGALENWDREIQ